ncbi:hypothetical protein CDAR_487341 [Caerostris darwini]|uniref:Uncharacterized protein n=1 Tax=Caerostris darwini TaxID=1538125 RepID=A0AAV4N054_9ARAC|nr:hypothetical protein CDAR_487341 [Caerostris darwini]
MSCESFVHASLREIWRREVKEEAAMCRSFLLLRHDSIGYFVISSVPRRKASRETLIILETPGPSVPGIYCPLPTIHHPSSAPGMARPDKAWRINSCRRSSFGRDTGMCPAKASSTLHCASYGDARRKASRETLITLETPGPSVPGIYCPLPAIHHLSLAPGMVRSDKACCINSCRRSSFGRGTGICLAEASSALHCARYGDASKLQLNPGNKTPVQKKSIPRNPYRPRDTGPHGSRHLLPSSNYSPSEFGTWNGKAR